MISRRYLFAAVALTACHKESGEPPKKFKLTGEIIKLDEPRKTALIRHEKIEGFMEAMTMDFPVRSAAEWAKLKPGQRVEAVLYYLPSEPAYWISEVKVLP